MKLDDILDKLNEVGYDSREELVDDLEMVFKDKILSEIAEVLHVLQFKAERQIQDALEMNDRTMVFESIGAFNGIEMTLSAIEGRSMKLKTHMDVKKEPLH